jgi:hypothetical protein
VGTANLKYRTQWLLALHHGNGAYIEKQKRKAEWGKLKSLRDSGAISREEFKNKRQKCSDNMLSGH